MNQPATAGKFVGPGAAKGYPVKKTVCLVIVMLAAGANISASPLNDVIRGKSWKELDTTSKAVYIKGVEDSIVLLGSANPGTKILTAYDGILSKDVEKIGASLDNFYADGDNLNISAVDSLLIISDYLKGMPQNKIDRLLTAFRQQSLKEIQHLK